MSDGETVRAQMCARVWAGLSVTERGKLKTPAALLPQIDDLLKRSYAMGSPLADATGNVLLDPTQYSVPRFREWLMLLPPEVRALYAEVLTAATL